MDAAQKIIAALLTLTVRRWRKRKRRKASEKRHRDEKAWGKPHNEREDI
jgi:hypothetical protein